jgi:hypothetical protein
MNAVIQLTQQLYAQAEANMPKLKSDFPKCPRGFEEYLYEDGLVPMLCFMEYEPAERGTDIDPAWDARMHLDAAYIGSIDVFSALTTKQITAIEEAAMGERG